MHLTCIDVNGEMALLVSGSDVVVNISIGANIFTRSINLYHFRAHCDIFRKCCQIVPPLKHGWVVVYVENCDSDVRKRGKLNGNALI